MLISEGKIKDTHFWAYVSLPYRGTEQPCFSHLLVYSSDRSPLYCSRTVWQSWDPRSWPHLARGWHDLLPFHRVLLYGRLLPDRLAHSPVSGKWNVVWRGSELHEWVSYAKEEEIGGVSRSVHVVKRRKEQLSVYTCQRKWTVMCLTHETQSAAKWEAKSRTQCFKKKRIR